MSTSKAKGFLEDICANSDDDTPRLVYADWLEEQGDSDRAEFIRVQIQRTQLPEWDARLVPLRLRERDLLQKHERQWRAELPGTQGVTWDEFRRGFVATADINSFSVLRANAGAIWAAAPLEMISIRWPRQREAIETIGPIIGLRELNINTRLVDRNELGLLADAPLLSTLRALRMAHCSVGVDGFRRLLASPHFGNLRALRMPFNHIGNGGVGALFDAASLQNLEELDLSESGSYGRYDEDPILEATGLESLAAWSGMRRMRALTLSGNSVGREGLRALLRSSRATSLKKLVLRDNGLDGQAMQEFVSAHPDLRLDVLDLGGNLLKDLGVADLALAPCLRELKSLTLDRCELPVSAARSLARAPFLQTLRHLNVNHNNLGAEGVYALLDKNPPALHTLHVVNNDLGKEGVSYLADSPGSDTLLELNLASNKLDEYAVQALANAKHLQKLLLLFLQGNSIDKLAAAQLRESSFARRLAVLEVGNYLYDDEIPF